MSQTRCTYIRELRIVGAASYLLRSDIVAGKLQWFSATDIKTNHEKIQIDTISKLFRFHHRTVEKNE